MTWMWPFPAEEALERARQKKYALFLVDVEMPGMDGFTFVERVRADAGLRDIPAILVTSLASPEDRQRGQEVGAQGYIVKSEFDQARLLAHDQSVGGVGDGEDPRPRGRRFATVRGRLHEILAADPEHRGRRRGRGRQDGASSCAASCGPTSSPWT